MKESNQLHAVCLDAYPPAIYMNNTSHAISAFVHEYNNIAKGQKVSYFFLLAFSCTTINTIV